MVGGSMQVFRYPPCPRLGLVDTPRDGVQRSLYQQNMVWYSGYYGMYGNPGILCGTSIGSSEQHLAGYCG